MSVSFTLNGRAITVERPNPHETLLDYLRGIGLTGAKEGCAEGECGACAVILVSEAESGGSQYQAVNGCLMLMTAVDGREVLTVEGMSEGNSLHPVQQALVQQNGSQCGYCTPGFAVSLFAEYYRPNKTAFDPESISGNLCRCTGYRPICAAGRSLKSPQADDPFKKRLDTLPATPTSTASVTEDATAHRPTSLAELTDLTARHPTAKLVAGATDVGVEVNQRGSRWPILIHLDAVPELQRFESKGDALVLGAGLSLTEVQSRLNQDPFAPALLTDLFPLFASLLIRNRATLGGNIANASPIGDAPPALLALGAALTLHSSEGDRSVELSEFFTGYKETRLRPGELIREVRIPKPFPKIQAFHKVSKRRMDDISTVSAGFAVDVESSGNVRSARLAFGGVGATPLRIYRAEDLLTGQPWNGVLPESVANAVLDSISPIDDHRGTARYRKAMAVSLLSRFCAETGVLS